MSKNRGGRRSNPSIWVVSGVAVAVVGLLVLGNLWVSRPKKPANLKSDQEIGAVRNVKGRADAKVTVVEYNDYL